MPDRTHAPDFAIPQKLDFLKPERQQLASGAPLYVLPGGSQRVIRMEVIYKAGKWHESQSGVSHFCAKMLQEGSKNFSAKSIAENFDMYGAHYEAMPGHDFTHISLHCLSDKVSRILPLLADILQQPTFPSDELNKIKDNFRQSLAINLQKNNYLASKIVREKLYSKLHPYGVDIEMDDLALIQPELLLNYHQEFYKDFIIFITGAFADNTLREIKEALGEIPYQANPSTALKNINSNYEKVIIDKPDSLQSAVKLACLCFDRKHPDYFKLLLFNHVLGGYFGSRLMKNIREEKGLTYGIYSGVHALKNSSYFVVSAEVNKENNKIVIEEIYKEMQELADNLISEEELQIAVNNFIGGMQAELSTVFAHADKARSIVLNELEQDYHQKLLSTFLQASPATVQTTAQSFLKQSKFVEVTVG